MGRRVANGDLCLVIGCDKTTSWGIATFSDSLKTTSRLQYNPVTSDDDPGRHYIWEHSGTADSLRVGPDGGQLSPNQCLFVRYLNFKLRKIVLPFSEPTGVQAQTESRQSTLLGRKQLDLPNVGLLQKFRSMLSQFRWFVSSPSNKEGEVPTKPSEDSFETTVRVDSASSLSSLIRTTAYQKISSFTTYLNDHLLPVPKLPHHVEWNGSRNTY